MSFIPMPMRVPVPGDQNYQPPTTLADHYRKWGQSPFPTPDLPPYYQAYGPEIMNPYRFTPVGRAITNAPWLRPLPVAPPPASGFYDVGTERNLGLPPAPPAMTFPRPAPVWPGGPVPRPIMGDPGFVPPGGGKPRPPVTSRPPGTPGIPTPVAPAPGGDWATFMQSLRGNKRAHLTAPGRANMEFEGVRYVAPQDTQRAYWGSQKTEPGGQRKGESAFNRALRWMEEYAGGNPARVAKWGTGLTPAQAWLAAARQINQEYGRNTGFIIPGAGVGPSTSASAPRPYR